MEIIIIIPAAAPTRKTEPSAYEYVSYVSYVRFRPAHDIPCAHRTFRLPLSRVRAYINNTYGGRRTPRACRRYSAARNSNNNDDDDDNNNNHGYGVITRAVHIRTVGPPVVVTSASLFPDRVPLRVPSNRRWRRRRRRRYTTICASRLLPFLNAR